MRTIVGPDDTTLCATWNGNLLRDPLPEPWEGGAHRLLAWSGTLADELFAAHPATWLRPGHEALAAACERLAPGLADTGRTICLRPHARHVLSDPGSTFAFAREHPDGPFEVALDPAAMLEATMLDDADDHLRRAFEAIGAVAAIVVLSDVAPGTEDDGRLRRVPLGQGELPGETLRSLLRRCVPETTPVLLGGGEIAAQLRWLEGC